MKTNSLAKLDIASQVLLFVDKLYPQLEAAQLYVNTDNSHTIYVTVVGSNGNNTDLSLNVDKFKAWINTHYLAIIPITSPKQDDMDLHDALVREAFDQIDNKSKDITNEK